MTELILGALVGLLVASAGLNGFLLYTRWEAGKSWRERARVAEDAKKAAELRSAQQIDTMLDRIHTTPDLTLRASVPDLPPLQKRTYISDNPADDAVWDEYASGAREATP